MALLRLFDPCTQFQVKSGALNTSGKLKVFLNGTDDYAVVRDDYGTEIAQPVILDNNGRSRGLLVDGNRLYRLEVYDRFDTLLFTIPNMAPISGAGGGGISGGITSSDGSIIVTDNGGKYDLSVADGEPDAWISANSAEYSYRTTDGTFGLVEGDSAGDAFEVVDHALYIRKAGWYHVAADFSATKNSAVANTYDDITFTVCGENHRVTLDMSRNDDRAFGAYASDFRFADGDTVSVAVSGISQGATAVLDRLAVHRIANAINGEDAGVYTGGEGIVVDNVNFEISIDPTVVQEKLTAGSNIVISDNVISATAEPQEQADWDQDDSEAVDFIKNKPDIPGMISDALEDYTPTASLAPVATSGDYDDLSNKPTIPTVDQTYSPSSTNAQSGTAVAGALADYTPTSSLAPVATSGDYSDLSGTPTIPTATSDLTNDSGFITLADVPAQVNSDWDAVSGVAEILNKPDLSIYATSASLATVATSGDYDDLTNKPSIPAAQVNSDWNAVSGVAQILNKPSLATVAISGDYDDLSNKPSIPVIGTITL